MSSSPTPPPPPDGASLCEQISTHLHSGNVYTISLLPAHHGPALLFSDRDIGIPKPLLLAAYSYAHAQPLSIPPGVAAIPDTTPGSPAISALFASTLLLLLCAPEHTTALSLRRRLLLLHHDHYTPERELTLLTSLFSSPLPKHTKSPALWAHRRWLFSTFPAQLKPWSGLRNELENAVLPAERQHPRNYYAWAHARWACGVWEEEPREMEEIVRMVREFCLREAVSCCSPWEFLRVLLEREGMGELRQEVMDEVMDTAHRLLRGHESVWCFVRTVLRKDVEMAQSVKRLKGWVGDGAEEGVEAQREWELEKKALAWLRKWGDLGIEA
ncbi:hypothetical protein EDC01DRAFT_663008 [Geopyxis carbonaria]|nr:hypothetical protein EDC01DRAFT_663008 [Geopyxis carbonaria]